MKTKHMILIAAAVYLVRDQLGVEALAELPGPTLSDFMPTIGNGQGTNDEGSAPQPGGIGGIGGVTNPWADDPLFDPYDDPLGYATPAVQPRGADYVPDPTFGGGGVRYDSTFPVLLAGDDGGF